MSETTGDADRGRNRDARERNDLGAMKWLSAVAALIGLWIAASPFVYDTTETALWNNVAVGLAILVLAGYNYYRMSDRRPASVGSAGLVVLLGLWTVVAPFVLSFGSDAMIWSNIASGSVVAALAAYNAYTSRRARAAATTRTSA